VAGLPAFTEKIMANYSNSWLEFRICGDKLLAFQFGFFVSDPQVAEHYLPDSTEEDIRRFMQEQVDRVAKELATERPWRKPND
jgi:hypothetical protein